MSIALRFESTFDTIYSTDLVYAPDCWKLCGDANCCNFTRYKSQMSILGKSSQELPLLPGEMEFLTARGWDKDFGEFELRVIEFPIELGTMKLEFLAGRPGSCACKHDTRTTVCRLYPLMPIYGIDGRILDVDTRFGMFEEIESIDGIPRACKIENVPFSELGKFLAISNAVATNPTQVFYIKAFQLAKAHATERLRVAKQSARPGLSTLRMFEGLFALKQLLDSSEMRRQLNELAGQFRSRYGESFTVA